MSLLHRFLRDESGATAIEYVMIASFVAGVIVISVRLVGTNTASRYSAVANNLT